MLHMQRNTFNDRPLLANTQYMHVKYQVCIKHVPTYVQHIDAYVVYILYIPQQLPRPCGK